MSLKEKFMNKMMEDQFQGMSSEDKKQMMEAMMDKFFSSMSDEEKKEMMSGMMPKMMEQMMGNSAFKGKSHMMGMMSMMMGKGKKEGESGEEKMPWDMCREMMSGFRETASTAKFATPELRGLFDEWCQQIEKEILNFVKEKNSINVTELADKFSLSEESIRYFLTRLAKKNLIDFKV